MSLDITNGINGRINTLYWSKYATVLNPTYQTPTCHGVYELGTVMAFKPPEGGDMGAGVMTVDDILRKHVDFWKMFDFYQTVFNDICSNLLLIGGDYIWQ